MKKYLNSSIIQLAVLIGMVISVFAAGCCGDVMNKSRISDDVFRLHILANSDSEADQKLKLTVRDAILQSGDFIFSDCVSSDEASRRAGENLDFLRSVAEDTLRRNGCRSDVHCEVTEMEFDERVYGSVTMPAGNYKALRITIGEAKGKNWWCVMYPPLCLPAVTNVDEALKKAESDGIIDSEEVDILNNPEKYEVRFYFAELAEKLFADRRKASAL